MLRAVACWAFGEARYGRGAGGGGVNGHGHGARRALTRDLGLLASIAGVAGVAGVEHLLGAGQVLFGLLRHPWGAGRRQA